MSPEICELSITDLLNCKDSYIIPIYQRNYAWEEGEIHQLIEDVRESQPAEKKYYLGTLVVARRPDDAGGKNFETIDGQQRLTTLTLLATYLKIKDKHDFSSNLRFDSRKTSNVMLERIFNKETNIAEKDEIRLSSAIPILNGYKIIESYMDREFKNGEALKKFADYFFEKVKIMRVEVPEGTNLNHYFEIMNNRGEQLEKHEVLKARLMANLKEEDRPCFHHIWEACANMEKYVQTGFCDPWHKNLFGDDGCRFTPKTFDDMKNWMPVVEEGMSSQTEPTLEEPTLDNILNPNSKIGGDDLPQSKDPSTAEIPERFRAVINFPNFLLHVLRISSPSDCSQDLPFDDKKLIDAFEYNLLKGDEETVSERVKKFAFHLLKGRYLLDRYVIKKEYSASKERWSLRKYQKTVASTYPPSFGAEDNEDIGINRRILMLLAAFHVSAPSLTRKYWLYAALKFLFDQDETTAEDHVSAKGYLDHLENTAKAFMFDRYLAAGEGLDYFDIIEKNHGKSRQSPGAPSENDFKDRLSFDRIENIFVFNYLDYLLWLKHRKKEKKVDKVIHFEFTLRSSVEHLYPQNPDYGEKWEEDDLNSFGNLCLISPSNNSRYSNLTPSAKKEHFENKKLESIKQFLMMEMIKIDDDWDKEKSTKHEVEMIKILFEGPPDLEGLID